MRVISSFGAYIKTRYALVLVAFVGYVVFSRLYLLTTAFEGISYTELTSHLSSRSLDIINSPVNFFYTFLQRISFEVLGQTVLALRLPSVILSCIAITLFYLLISSWWNRRIALFASIFLASSSWILALSRLGTPGIEYLVLFSLGLFLFNRFISDPNHIVAAFFGIVIGLSLYTPYMLYFWLAIMIGSVILYLNGQFSFQAIHVIIALLTFTIAVGPLLISLINLSTTREALIGIGPNGIFGGDIVESVKRLILSLVGKSPQNQSLTLTSEPLFQLPLLILVVLGFYELIKQLSKVSHVIVFCVLTSASVGIIISGGNDIYAYVALAMPLFVLAALGLRLLLSRWYAMFPYNLAARSAIVAPISLLILLVAYLGHTQHFNAWRLNPEVRSLYQIDRSALEANL